MLGAQRLLSARWEDSSKTTPLLHRGHTKIHQPFCAWRTPRLVRAWESTGRYWVEHFAQQGQHLRQQEKDVSRQDSSACENFACSPPDEMWKWNLFFCLGERFQRRFSGDGRVRCTWAASFPFRNCLSCWIFGPSSNPLFAAQSRNQFQKLLRQGQSVPFCSLQIAFQKEKKGEETIMGLTNLKFLCLIHILLRHSLLTNSSSSFSPLPNFLKRRINLRKPPPNTFSHHPGQDGKGKQRAKRNDDAGVGHWEILFRGFVFWPAGKKFLGAVQTCCPKFFSVPERSTSSSFGAFFLPPTSVSQNLNWDGAFTKLFSESEFRRENTGKGKDEWRRGSEEKQDKKVLVSRTLRPNFETFLNENRFWLIFFPPPFKRESAGQCHPAWKKFQK